jgi:hypothetical protein
MGEDELLELATELARSGVRSFALQELRPVGLKPGLLRRLTRAAHPSESLLAQLRALFAQFTHRRAQI